MNTHHGAATPQEKTRSVHLGLSGARAQISEDPHGGFVLEIGGAVQSHVDLQRPQDIRYEYLRRMAAVVDGLGAPGAPLRVLHLGAGALTLPRRLAVIRPGSAQTVVDWDRELVSFVCRELPLPAGAHVDSIVADAREAVGTLLQQEQTFDAVILDIGTSDEGSHHLRRSDFYEELLSLINPQGGALLINIGDDDGLAVLGAEIVALDWAAHDGEQWTLAPADMVEHLSLGNAVMVLTQGIDPKSLRTRLEAAGPHPAAVLDRNDSLELAERIAKAAERRRSP